MWLTLYLHSIFFLIFNRSATVSSLTTISTFVAALSFIFSNVSACLATSPLYRDVLMLYRRPQAASTLFNSLIFIFSTQPYSIGELSRR